MRLASPLVLLPEGLAAAVPDDGLPGGAAPAVLVERLARWAAPLFSLPPA
jgi:hypothetical protein